MGKEDMICNEQQYMSPPAKKRAAIGNMQGTDIDFQNENMRYHMR